VIDRESYENPEIAAVINRFYVPVKVDRDERPDVDSRYQSAISAISGQGGWPLTAFLTPDGKPFFGGTYFPPEDAMGRPGFKRILASIAEAFKTRRAEVDTSAVALEAVSYTHLDVYKRQRANIKALPRWRQRNRRSNLKTCLRRRLRKDFSSCSMELKTRTISARLCAQRWLQARMA